MTSSLTAPSLWCCAATALASTRSIAHTIAPLAKLPHVMFFGGGVVIKL
jgi:hypothetical protein